MNSVSGMSIREQEIMSLVHRSCNFLSKECEDFPILVQVSFLLTSYCLEGYELCKGDGSDPMGLG